MIVSTDWLKEYVPLTMSVDELTDRLTMTGLNLEGVEDFSGDTGIDLEVTSNRPDCLGHIGVAREVSVLFDQPLSIPAAEISCIETKTAEATSVEIESEDLCPQYIARVIRGVKIGPSPSWMQKRLGTLGIACINNVVDITNYVLMECSQPLHAFDFEKLAGSKIIVRQARAGEKLTAIDQREYELSPEMCVIADAERPVAIAGVMGGLDTEISDDTTSVLIETASFAPLSVRSTARKLHLHSDSSFRFERGVDRVRMDWASRRCCELILEIAGGELLDEPIVAGSIPSADADPVPIRFSQVNRLLGIEVSANESSEILESLGLTKHENSTEEVGQFSPPTWRRDLTRECDLVEEVARIHGYEKIPVDADVPVVSTSKSRRDRVVDRVCRTLNSLGYFEAITLSFVDGETRELFVPRGVERVQVEHSSRKQENHLRQTLIGSLLHSRRENERHGNFDADLFEIAKVYLSDDPERKEREYEPTVVGMVSGKAFAEVRGCIEALLNSLNISQPLTARPSDVAQFVPGRGAELMLGDERWGWLGELDRSCTDKLDLRDAVTVAEVNLHLLEDLANLVPEYSVIGQFPAMMRDMNFELADTVTWEQLELTVRDSAGPLLESVRFSSQYRGKQIATGSKSYVLSARFRSPERTLTADEVNTAQQAIVSACEEKLGAKLR